MICVFILLFAFFHRTSSSPADSCGDQFQCLKTEITGVNGQYQICLWWDSSLSSCDKDGKDSMSHACPSDDESDKIEGMKEGQENALCNIVDCDGYAVFGIKDGKGCGGSSGVFGFSGVNGIYCGSGTEGGYCGGGNQKDCMWIIPAPECTTTTPPPEPTTTSSVSVTTTTKTSNPDPTVTDTPPTTTVKTIETTTTVAVDCTVDEPPCPEFGDLDSCENGPVAGCKWDELTGTCSVDECALSESNCVAACGCQYLPLAGCFPDPEHAASNAHVRQDVYDANEDGLVSEETSAQFNFFGLPMWAVYAMAGGIALVLISTVAAGIYCAKKRKHAMDIANMEDAVEMTANPMVHQVANESTTFTLTVR